MRKNPGQITRFVFLTFVTLVLVSLSGCYRTTADELYSLPQASKEYLELQKQINAVLASGAEYSPPASGPNRQSVQLRDLDGDEINEAVAFFRTTGDKPLQIYIMKQANDSYETVNTIDGIGTAIDSIRYADMDGDGRSELIVGWQMSPTLLHMTIYDIRDGGHTVLADTDYSKLFLSDLTDDGRSDVIALRLSSSDLPGEAILFSLSGNRDVITSKAGLSGGLESVTSYQKGRLNDATPAVYIEGGIGGTNIVTDIFCWLDNSLVNVTVKPSSGVSEETMRTSKAASYSADINEDGIIDVPSPRMLEPGSDKSFYVIDWYSYNRSGEKKIVYSTYHNSQDGWYLVLPFDWKDTVIVRREDTIPGERTVIFSYAAGGGAAATDFLRIYALSGDNKEDRAQIGGRFKLHVQGDVIYAAEVLTTDIPVTISKTTITESFRLIYKQWSTGVY